MENEIIKRDWRHYAPKPAAVPLKANSLLSVSIYTRLHRCPREVPLASMTSQAVLQNTSHYSRIAKSGTSWNKCHLRRSLTAEGLLPTTGTLSPVEGQNVHWVMRPFPSGYISNPIAAQFNHFEGTLLWAKCLTLNALSEMIFVEIFSVNLIHTLKIGTYL